MPPKHAQPPIDARAPVAGAAALSLVESILLILKDNGTLAAHDIDEIYEMAIDAHENSIPAKDNLFHVNVANILRVLRTQGNAVRLPEARQADPTRRTVPDDQN